MIKVEDRAIGRLAGLMAGDTNGGPTAIMMKNLETAVRTMTLFKQCLSIGTSSISSQYVCTGKANKITT